MWQSVIVAVITGGLSFIGIAYSTRKSHDTTIQEIKYEIATIKKDISTLDEKVSKHNNLIERMYNVEKTVTVLDERQRTANHRIDDLEVNNGK